MNFLYIMVDSSRVAYRRYYAREGADLAPDLKTYPVRNLSFSSNSTIKAILTPNKKSILRTSSYSSNTFSTTPDVDYPGIAEKPSVSFSGNIYAGACSNDHYAVGGSNPYLYVFRWADSSLETVNTAGLGEVRGLAFSPDGSKLAVAHGTAPYLRVYDVADWSYLDAQITAGNGRTDCIFTADGSHVITGGTSSPHLSMFDVTDMSRVHVATSTSNIPGGFYMASDGEFIRDEEDDDRIFFHVGNTTAHQIGVYTVSTRTAERFNYTGASFNTRSMAIDYSARKIYVSHRLRDLPTGGKSTYVTIFDLDTLEIDDQQSDELYATITHENAVLLLLQKDTGKVSGTVRDITNSPAQREVIAYRRSDNLLLGRTLSDPVTGNYELMLPDDSPIDLQFKALDGELLNDIFYAAVQPELIP